MTNDAIQRSALSLFCIWHMAAVALYALPPHPQDPVTRWLKGHVQPVANPYVLGLSQWQQWNIFGPDPTRRISRSVMERWNGLEWVTMADFGAQEIPWWKKMPLVKTIRRLEDGPYRPIQERFLSLFCKRSDLPDGTMIRFRAEYAMIPSTRMSITDWQAWKPEWKEEIVSTVQCPAL